MPVRFVKMEPAIIATSNPVHVKGVPRDNLNRRNRSNISDTIQPDPENRTFVHLLLQTLQAVVTTPIRQLKVALAAAILSAASNPIG